MHQRCQPSLAIAGVVILFLCAMPVTAQSYRPVLTPVPGDSGVSLEVERHPNGALAKRVFMKNGQPDGLWQEWDADGRVRMLAEWRDGKGEGVWMYFHPNGFVRERSWVTGDVWHGPSEGWHANGQKAFEGTHVRGAKAAPFRYWREDGTPRGPSAQLLTATANAVPLLVEGWPNGFNVWDVSFSRDLETLFVGTGDDDGNNRRIMMRRWVRDEWQPVELAPFADTTAAEGTPQVSADGEWVYFSSARHAVSEPDNPHRELYRASRSSGWKLVERVTRTPLYGEVSLSLASDGRGVVWTDRQRDGAASMGLYEVRLERETSSDAPTLTYVADLSTLHVGEASGEAYPVMSPDGSFLLFSNYDIDGTSTREDVYLTQRTAAGWSTPRRLTGDANSVGDDLPVQVVGDGRVLLFASSRSQGARLYGVSLDAVTPQDTGFSLDEMRAQSVHAALAGSFAGSLRYRDYQDSSRFVTLPTELAVTLGVDSASVQLDFTYDDGPGKTVRSSDRLALDLAARVLRWGPTDGRGEPSVFALRTLRGGDTIRLVAETEGRDDDRPATLRETITVSAQEIRIVKDVRFTRASPWLFRHEYLLRRR